MHPHLLCCQVDLAYLANTLLTKTSNMSAGGKPVDTTDIQTLANGTRSDLTMDSPQEKAGRAASCGRVRPDQRHSTYRTRDVNACLRHILRTTQYRCTFLVHLARWQPAHPSIKRRGLSNRALVVGSVQLFLLGVVVPKATGWLAWSIGPVGLLTTRQTFKLRRVSGTQRSSNDDESILRFRLESICYGTSAKPRVLPLNGKMERRPEHETAGGPAFAAGGLEHEIRQSLRHMSCV